MLLRADLFDQGDNLAGGIYGTILVTSVVAAADGTVEIWRSLGIVEVTVLVFWLAHVYANALAWRLDSNRGVLAREPAADRPQASGRSYRPRSSRRSRSSPVLSASSRTQAAYWVAIGYGVGALDLVGAGHRPQGADVTCS